MQRQTRGHPLKKRQTGPLKIPANMQKCGGQDKRKGKKPLIIRNDPTTVNVKGYTIKAKRDWEMEGEPDWIVTIKRTHTDDKGDTVRIKCDGKHTVTREDTVIHLKHVGRLEIQQIQK